MFNVTQSAQDQVADYFKDKEIKPIRIFLNQGCGGAQLAMAIDEIRDTDKVFKFAGIEYTVEKKFLKQAQPIEVDFLPTGFKVTSSLELSGGCSSCGTTGTCCS